MCSDYIIFEVEKTCKKYDILRSEESFSVFLQYMKISVFASRTLRLDGKYVYDPFDLQVLQDAIDVHVELLLTNNKKDFAIDEIWEDFGLEVDDHI